MTDPPGIRRRVTPADRSSGESVPFSCIILTGRIPLLDDPFLLFAAVTEIHSVASEMRLGISAATNRPSASSVFDLFTLSFYFSSFSHRIVFSRTLYALPPSDFHNSHGQITPLADPSRFSSASVRNSRQLSFGPLETATFNFPLNHLFESTYHWSTISFKLASARQRRNTRNSGKKVGVIGPTGIISH